MLVVLVGCGVGWLCWVGLGWWLRKLTSASTSVTFVVSLNKQQIVDCDRANNYGRPELFVSDFSARAARFGRQRRRESFVC